MTKSLALSLIYFLTAASAARAALYVPAAPVDGKSGLTFAIGYTGGLVHEGFASVAAGEVDLDPATLAVQGGEIGFPIAALDSGNAKRNCHIRESLGLDYTRSVYPKDHVCGGSNTLPAEGADAVAFPEMGFRFISFKDGQVTGTFSLHGIQKDLTVPVVLSNEAGGNVRLKASFTLHLPDYGVIVKKFLFVTVDDDAKVGVDLILTPKRAN
ncbi:MAG: YceI family protein [Bdellovibrionales bacterium]|nr:YceI family protein [Bdellovibrionales bacterium]